MFQGTLKMLELLKRSISSYVEKHIQDQGTSCIHFVTTNADFAQFCIDVHALFAQKVNFL